MLTLHPQLTADCHSLGHLRCGMVLLHRNASVPWLILVPETDLTDLLQLPKDQQTDLMSAAGMLGKLLRDVWSVPKINFAAIGNIVPQLHLHIVGRSPDDACWPLPVWGHLKQTATYSPTDLERLRSKLASALPDFRPIHESTP